MQKLIACLATTVLLCVFFNHVNAQAYINFSKYSGGSGAEGVAPTMKVINGETYFIGSTTSPDFPVTNGSTYKGGTDIIIAKYASNGNLLYATYLGGSNDDYDFQMKTAVVNGELYIATTTKSPDYPVTNASSFKGVSDLGITKLGTNGAILFSTYVGGSNEDLISGSAFNYNNNIDMLIVGNEIIIAGSTASPDFPHTVPGNNYGGGTYDTYLAKLNATTGTLIQSRFIGGSNYESLSSLIIENGFAYLTIVSNSQNIPVTIPTTYTVSDAGEVFATKINLSNLGTVYARYTGPNIIAFRFYVRSAVINGELHLYGSTMSNNMPVTNGSTSFLDQGGNNYLDGFYTRLSTDGTIAFSTYLATEGFDYVYNLIYRNGTVYITSGNSNVNNGGISIMVYKINPNGSFAYKKKLKAGVSNNNSYNQGYLNMEEVNGDLYLAGNVYYPEYPVTNNSQFYANGTGYFTHLNAAGDIVYSSFLGKMQSLSNMKYVNNKFYLLGASDIPSYPVTDNSTIKGGQDILLMILNPDGSNYYSTYIGGEEGDFPTALEVFNTDIYLGGVTNSFSFPVTQNSLYKGNADRFITKLSFCPDKYLLSNDTIRPLVQAACKNGLGQKITGQEITVPSDSLPVIYRNGVPESQKPVGATYQWQVAGAINGPYTDIVNAVLKDYTPVLGTETQYYRRLAFRQPQCGGTLVHISDTATVTANSLTAPVLDLAGPYTTCPGSSIPIGGSPTVSGGNPPYTSYEWDNALPAVANPAVSPVLNTIYTLTVTDNAGCKQIGQALVHVYKANAGLDKSNCQGVAVKIGGTPVAGLPGAIYQWQPAHDLSGTNVAQPYANPPAVTDYELILTVPKTGGGTCITKDTMKVIPASAPITLEFAGPDRVTCLGDTSYLGTPAEAGYNYIWSPGSYLTGNTTSTTKYFAGNVLMPDPNPAVINLTAQKAGCFFADQVEVATIESRAGLLGCGPRMVGMPDRTPYIVERYEWKLVSGPGRFIGPTDLPQVPVSASVGGTSVYGLTVSYNGGSCYSEVTVPAECVGCNIVFDVDAKYKCPSYDVNFSSVRITALNNVPNPIYDWEPKAGLSGYNSQSVYLTDNVQRTYIVTITSSTDTTIRCVKSIDVNDPAFSRPVFDAPDVVTCVNQPVTIGATTVAGYTYTWEGNGLSDYYSSSPTATVPVLTYFPVRVTDGNGCILEDTVLVNVENVEAAAGKDWIICNNGVIKLGSPALPGINYVWEPQSSPWQNGTNQFSAQPEVLVASDIRFYVTATTPAGCIIQDSADVIINSSPVLADAPDTFVCKGSSVMIGLPELPGVTYQWTPATGLNNPTLAQPTVIIPQASITYTLQATFPGGCALPSTDGVTVTVRDPSFDMPDISFCPANGPVQLGTAAPADMASYTWQPYYQVSNPLIANPFAVGGPVSTPSTYILTVIDPAGCTASDSITINPVVLTVSAGPDAAICKGSTVTIGSLTNTPGQGINYSWSPATGLNNASVVNPTFTSTATGVFKYYLTKTSNNPACSAVDSVVVTVDELSLPAMPGPSVCQNGCVQIGTAAVQGVQYSWSPASGLSDANVSNPVACPGTISKTYTLTANNAAGCTATGSVLVTVNSAAAAQAYIPAVSGCVGDTGIHLNAYINAGPYSFLWSPDDGSLSNTSTPNPAVLNTSAGSRQYVLQVTDTVTGCSNTVIGNLTINNCSSITTIGDFMWFDTDGNGLQDNGELGVSNMTVKLYSSAGYLQSTAVTNSNGYYSFDNITPGNGYYIVFDKPAGYTFTTQNVGGTAAANNSKADQAGRCNSFNVAAGISIMNIDAGIKATGTTPVRLLSFTGNLQNNRTTLLNWQTTAEYNNHHFEIERSIDGIHFVVIGKVNGNGTTSLPHSYSFVDAHPSTGINYYRLKQVDLDGNNILSHVVRILLNNNETFVTFYNQGNHSIEIIFSKKQANTQLKLFAANGQLVKAAAVKNTNRYLLELPLLANSMYLLQVANEKGSYTEKIFIGK
ncbi:MAG: SdrD B-like domain-containing protein [Ferruginibacter sp.]